MVMSIEKFAEQVIKSFDDIRKEIADIKKDLGEHKAELHTHLKVEAELEEYKKDLKKKQDKKVYLILALIGSAITIFEVTNKIMLSP